MTFSVKKISSANLSNINEIGFDNTYSSKAIDKYQFQCLKIYNLTAPQASIIKQTALSLGTDAAIHREVLTCKIEKSDVILAGSKRQLLLIANKLEKQPFSLPKLAKKIKAQLNIKPININIRSKKFEWNKKTYIMGILNLTPDSFSDGGKFNSTKSVLLEVDKMIENGVDILDIGGESTRPYADEIHSDEEIKRVIPALKAIREKHPNLVISIDTRNSKTAKEAMLNGADIINDVSMASWDKEILELAKDTNAFYIINHTKGNPQNMQDNPCYQNVIDDVYKDLNDAIEKALEAGIEKEKLIIDIGIGFGKSFEHNIELIKKIDEFSSFGLPILAGISRKSVISEITGKNKSNQEKDITTLVLNSYLASKNTNILRVHNVKLHKHLKAIDTIFNP